MIGFLRGVLVTKAPPQLVVDVNGVGYEVDAPMSTFYALPAVGTDRRPATLPTLALLPAMGAVSLFATLMFQRGILSSISFVAFFCD